MNIRSPRHPGSLLALLLLLGATPQAAEDADDKQNRAAPVPDRQTTAAGPAETAAPVGDNKENGDPASNPAGNPADNPTGADAQVIERFRAFRPSEAISADNAVPFPVDI